MPSQKQRRRAEHEARKAARSKPNTETQHRSTHRIEQCVGSYAELVEHAERSAARAKPSTTREKVRGFVLDQIEQREKEGFHQAPIAPGWAAKQLGLTYSATRDAMIALHRRGEVVATGAFTSRRHVRYWARGDGKPHTWPPPKPGPIVLPGSRVADCGDLLERAVKDLRVGNRNDRGFWLACQVRDTGAGRDKAQVVMETFWSLCPKGGSPPYTLKDALASLESAYGCEPRAPFRVCDRHHD